jgi:hypothetical protein
MILLTGAADQPNLLRFLGRGRRLEAHDEILSRFDLLVIEAGDLLELVERLADADLI